MSRTRNHTAGPGRSAALAAPDSGRRELALAAVLTAEAMNLLDATIVQVAGPVIHADLGGARGTIPWFSAAYTLAFALGLLTGARLGDIVGRRRVFRIGVTMFAATSLACALAPGAATLIALRAVQGAAAAAIIPQTFGLIRAMYKGDELTRALGMIGRRHGPASTRPGPSSPCSVPLWSYARSPQAAAPGPRGGPSPPREPWFWACSSSSSAAPAVAGASH
jgi:hypothetical protein